MPQIPVFTGSQRIEPGSPVAAVSPESSAGVMEGNMGEKFGSALFTLGNKLDEIGKNLKNRENTLNATKYVEDFEQDVILKKAVADKAAIIQGDSTGAIAGGVFRDDVQKLRADYMQNITDPEVKAMFDANANKIVSQYLSKRVADEHVKREQAVTIQQNEMLGKYVEDTFKNPRQATEMSQKAELIILSDPNQDEATKQANVVKYRDNIFNAAVDGMISKAHLADTQDAGNIQFNEARKMVYANIKLLPDEARKKILDKIDSQQKDFINTGWTIDQKTRALKEERAKDSREAAKKLFTKQLELNGNNDNGYARIMSEARDNIFLKAEDIDQLATGVEGYKKLGDDRYQMHFMDNIIKGKVTDYKKAEDQIINDVRAGNLSSSRADKLQNILKDLKETNKQHPNIQNVVAAQKQLIEESYKTIQIDPLSNVPMRVTTLQGYKAVAEFERKVSDAMTRGVISSGLVESFGKVHLKNGDIEKNVQGASTSDTSTLEGTRALMTDIAKKLRSGKMTPAEKAEATKQFKILQENEQIQIQREKNKIKGIDVLKNAPSKSINE